MEEKEAFRTYVLAGEEPKQIAPEGQIRLDVISEVLNGSPTASSNNWKNFASSLTISQFKSKLEMFVGTAPQYMKVQIFDANGQMVVELADENKTLSDYNIQNGQTVYVIDTDPNNTVKNLQDEPNFEKYVLSDEEYSKRENTYRKWKEENPDKAPKKPSKPEETFPQHIQVGNRCEIDTPQSGGFKRRGTVKYVGTIEGMAGYWVGVQLDEPLGKNDGSVKGVRLFECPPKYGSFVKPDKVTVGDFPEEDINADEI